MNASLYSPAVEPGSLIAHRFQIEAHVRSGGCGAVYRALDRFNGRPVAVKRLHDHAQPADRFKREAKVLEELDHPSVVKYIDHGVAGDGARYLVMEWLDGESLAQRLQRQALTVSESLRVARRVADALGAAHSRGLVHRDVKPSNVMLVQGRCDDARLVDFGTVLDPTATPVTGSGALVGTAQYMAPEQARADGQVTAASDVFSLGSVLYRCVTGRLAFSGPALVTLLAKLVLEDPLPARMVAPEVPLLLEDLLQRMLAKDPARRPPDGRAVALELERLSRRIGVGATQPSDSERPRELTDAEERVLSVAIAVRSEPSEVKDAVAELEACCKLMGAELERLRDGTWVATVAGGLAARDQVAAGARVALRMHALLPAHRIALATGRGVLGGQLPIGNVIERAAELLYGPAIVGVCVDEVTAALLPEHFSIDDGNVLLGERAAPPTGRRLLGKPTPLVGRTRELAILEAVLDECLNERVARAAIVLGEAGIGKSRLRYELSARALAGAQPPEIWYARGDPLSARAPFGLLAQALWRVVGIQGGEPLVTRQQKLCERVAARVAEPERRRVAEFMGELMGIRFDADASVQLAAARQDARLMGDQLRRAWEDFVTAECRAQPVLLVLEDLHWGDAPTVQLVDAALRTTAAFMVLATGRPELRIAFPNLWTGRAVTSIELGPLPGRASMELVEAALGDALDDNEKKRLVAHAAGNAFYLEEVIRAAARGDRDGLPETLVAMTQTRLDRFPFEARRVLRAASVFGATFWRGGVCALLGGEETLVDRWLPVLEDDELIATRERSVVAHDRELVFRHAMFREAAYAMLTGADRALGHRLAGAWLERAGCAEPSTLALHFERGEAPELAARWYRRAAEHALEGDDLEGALAWAERGLACDSAKEAGALWALKAEVHRWRGAHVFTEACALEAVERLTPGTAVYFHAVADAGVAAGKQGAGDRMAGCVARLDAAALSADASVAKAIALARIASELRLAGRYADAAQAAERAANTRPGAEHPVADAVIKRKRALRSLMEGDLDEGIAMLTAAIGGFDAAGDVRNACMTRVAWAHAQLLLGAHEQAAAALRYTLPAADRLQLHSLAGYAKHNLGFALFRMGQLEDALALQVEAAAVGAAHADARLEGFASICLALTHHEQRDFDAAERAAETACSVLSSTPPALAYALAVHARVLSSRGAAASSVLEAARRASALLDSLGHIEEGEVLVRLTLAEALHAAGERAAACEAIGAARQHVEELATRIADGARAAAFRASMFENARTLELARAWLED